MGGRASFRQTYCYLLNFVFIVNHAKCLYYSHSRFPILLATEEFSKDPLEPGQCILATRSRLAEPFLHPAEVNGNNSEYLLQNLTYRGLGSYFIVCR